MINRCEKNKCSVSDYFPDRRDNSPLFRSAQMHSVSPMLKSINLIRTPQQKQASNERLLEFEDGHHTIIDVNMLYGEEPNTSIPGLDRSEKEMLKQILVDLIDLSLNEYNVHYICHTDASFGRPYTHLRNMINSQLNQFYKYSVERIPFSLWNQVISEHYQILINILPLTLQKDLIDLRYKFTRGYARSRIERNWKEFQKRNKESPKEERKVRVFSTQASENAPTTVTDDEYQELVVSDILDTPFDKFLTEKVDKKRSVILCFLAFIKNEEPELIKTFNECFEINNEFYKQSNFRNRGIEVYKKQRGFPLKLGENETMLFSFDHKITYEKLLKMKVLREKEEKRSHDQDLQRTGISSNADQFFDD